MDKDFKKALITDDTPNAKKITLWCAIGLALVQIGLGVALFFSTRNHWNVLVTIACLLVWLVLDVLWWQLWRSVAFRLTVTEEEVILKLFCRKKHMKLQEIRTFSRQETETKFVLFTLKSDTTQLQLKTQYAEEMSEILKTRTAATEE